MLLSVPATIAGGVQAVQEIRLGLAMWSDLEAWLQRAELWTDIHLDISVYVPTLVSERTPDHPGVLWINVVVRDLPELSVAYQPKDISAGFAR